LQRLDVAVLVIARHVLAEAVCIRTDVGCFAVGRVQHPVQSVIGELVSADGAFIPCFPSHAADTAVVFGGAVAVVVVQILCKLASTDSRQPATDIIGIRQLVGGTSVQGL